MLGFHNGHRQVEELLAQSRHVPPPPRPPNMTRAHAQNPLLRPLLLQQLLQPLPCVPCLQQHHQAHEASAGRSRSRVADRDCPDQISLRLSAVDQDVPSADPRSCCQARGSCQLRRPLVGRLDTWEFCHRAASTSHPGRSCRSCACMAVHWWHGASPLGRLHTSRRQRWRHYPCRWLSRLLVESFSSLGLPAHQHLENGTKTRWLQLAQPLKLEAPPPNPDPSRQS
mmetsp:Transcript_2128/g.4847  ORF Transcript_2128/g.4847 Transcript_2128/m.4847 type:complete len:226 (-) Transcript_2128:383-1060(-)